MKYLITFIVFAMISFQLVAEEIPKFKFGKMTMEEMNVKICDMDSNAHAFYFFDNGLSMMEYVQGKGFRIKFTRHCRIKILDKNGYGAAEFQIPLYKSDSQNKESIGSIKAYTYNLEGNKIVESKLDKKDIFLEEKSKHWLNEKFTMPNVKEGSVIEVEYEVFSDFIWNLQSWNFQHSIPAKISIYEVRIPEYFDYHKEMRGYVQISQNSNSSSTGTITFVSNTQNSYASGANHTVNNINYTISHTQMMAKDVPAFKEEPYIDAPQNYFSRIKFELASTHYPSEPITNYTLTWEKICEKLMDNEWFGGQLDNMGFCKDIIKESISAAMPEIEKAKAIFELVKNKTKWNDQLSATCDEGIRKTFKDGVGSSGDINLLLTSLFRAADLKANPVVLKARHTGMLPITYPSISELNYVVAALEIEGKYYYLDATEDEIPFNLLPERCINGKGMLIKGSNIPVQWVELAQNTPSSYKSYLMVDISVDGTLSGTMTHRRTGHEALARRQTLLEDKEKALEELKNDYTGLEIEEYKFVNEKELSKPLDEIYTVLLPDMTSVAGNKIYFNPCLKERLDENPFKLIDREYPVDFAYPQEKIISNTFILPEGWDVESLPESKIYNLPENSGSFNYSIQIIGNKIQLIQKFIINKTIFIPTDYPNLKEFYSLIVAKQQEQAVLKKL